MVLPGLPRLADLATIRCMVARYLLGRVWVWWTGGELVVEVVLVRVWGTVVKVVMVGPSYGIGWRWGENCVYSPSPSSTFTSTNSTSTTFISHTHTSAPSHPQFALEGGVFLVQLQEVGLGVCGESDHPALTQSWYQSAVTPSFPRSCYYPTSSSYTPTNSTQIW